MTAAEQPPTSPTTLVVDLSSVEDPDLAMVEALARLVLLARRSNVRIQFRHTSRPLQDLVGLCGLGEVIG